MTTNSSSNKNSFNISCSFVWFKSIYKKTCVKFFIFSFFIESYNLWYIDFLARRYSCRLTAVLYLIQSVVVNSDVIQSDSLFDIFKMSLRSCQCKLIFVHVWNVLQDVVLPSLGNNLLGYNGSAMQHLLEGFKYNTTLTPQMMKRLRTENRPLKLADFH